MLHAGAAHDCEGHPADPSGLDRLLVAWMMPPSAGQRGQHVPASLPQPLFPCTHGSPTQAYAAMMMDEQRQAILISGESGAGKTESAKMVMQASRPCVLPASLVAFLLCAGCIWPMASTIPGYTNVRVKAAQQPRAVAVSALALASRRVAFKARSP